MDETLNLKLIDETELASGEDAPMSMAAHPEVSLVFLSFLHDLASFLRVAKARKVVCGVNSAADKVKKGGNQNCRFYDIEQMRCVLSKFTDGIK